MSDLTSVPPLPGRRVLIPGGTGGVGEGAVRAFLAAGADVIVPTRSQRRADEFRGLLGAAATKHLHLFEHDYTSFAGAAALVATMLERLGGIDDVVATIGGWWSGKPLWEIDETDWQSAFVNLATTHMAVLRASLPHMTDVGAYSIIVGESAYVPIPGSGLVSMEQTALQMMHQVLVAELQGAKRAFLLELGPVATRFVASPDPAQVTSELVGRVAVAASASAEPGRVVTLLDQTQAAAALASFSAAR
ncbi:SDR family oxidoreductase [Microbacterium protaetiae]|uniref:SDR family oxidoreductase n=1 Tax=Microbacterium protaetiae TaxID=2509458 RepID=A0A4P6EET5_9MICO|nr:SDR family oxidoreductase [Microbacterium protaetiae]QAY58577.1 SDR family oxidoreductase [Microbacterium protaetiae]